MDLVSRLGTIAALVGLAVSVVGKNWMCFALWLIILIQDFQIAKLEDQNGCKCGGNCHCDEDND